ncbi:MAG: VWA domain-containing protein [Bacteroidota bacterium]
MMKPPKILSSLKFLIIVCLLGACQDLSDKKSTPNAESIRKQFPPPPPPPVIEEVPEAAIAYRAKSPTLSSAKVQTMKSERPVQKDREQYAPITENQFRSVIKEPLSTFSIDVDAASYSNLRRFISSGHQPPIDAIRIEEMINYFDYDYPQPKGKHPFEVITEISDCPWNEDHRLVHIGLQGKKIATDNLPPSNLVFLLDVSGSMQAQNKLPLLQSSLKLLVNNLRAEDKVAIVAYAGAAGVILPATKGTDQQKIKAAIDKLQAGGSTAGAEGIQLAYQIAKENFLQEGNNRVILATDGDFNVGVSSEEALVKLIEKERKSGVFLTVLGFGQGNYQDYKMQELADRGNGNHAYIDNILEAKKVLVNEFGGTLFTIAKDVKLQIEFNPSKVQNYRLIGYENRLLAAEDFNNDRKDAGELGAGHTVTALYEIIPTGVKSSFANSVDPLKYQANVTPKVVPNAKELMTIKLRYKQPDGEKSQLMEKPILDQKIALEKMSDNFRFSAAVAEFGLLLRDSEFKNKANYQQVLQLAKSGKGKDKDGYRAELIRLVEMAELMSEKVVAERE